MQNALERGNDRLRGHALAALRRYGDERAGEALVWLLQADGDGRAWAARALRDVGGRRAVALLIGLFEEDDRREVRAYAVQVPGALGDRRAGRHRRRAVLPALRRLEGAVKRRSANHLFWGYRSYSLVAAGIAASVAQLRARSPGRKTAG